ncbi:uncharacterized protein LOC110463610 isoform X2 [Mizuhopecten yessoensis]|uniref:uncharacterized protein LOC110463610 isoform X2 n=1 Tax=Mizuhopecten yessoensis TaxID=6573 RepID=UPI000B45C772|nr:uncharacterized protein LOC110463610 isoform X2 [Mizuhopecten yessoensis]
MKTNGEPRQLEGYRNIGKGSACVCGHWFAVLACVISTGSCLCTVVLYLEVRTLRGEAERQHVQSPAFKTSHEIKSSTENTTLDLRTQLLNRHVHSHTYNNGHKGETSVTGLASYREKRKTGERNKQSCSCQKGAKGSRGRNGKKGKRGKNGKRGKKGPKGDKGETAVIGDINLPIGIPSGNGGLQPINGHRHVHFISDYDKDVPWDEFKGRGCRSLFDGEVCRNRRFSTTEVPNIFRFLKDREPHSDVTSLPVSQSDDGIYHIHQTGTYLVYLHAAMWSVNNTGTDVFAVVLDRRSNGRPSTVFNCQPLNNTWTGNHYDTLLQTCISARTLYLRKNDVLSIYLLSPDAEIDLSTGETYFGVLRLI